MDLSTYVNHCKKYFGNVLNLTFSWNLNLGTFGMVSNRCLMKSGHRKCQKSSTICCHPVCLCTATLRIWNVRLTLVFWGFVKLYAQVGFCSVFISLWCCRGLSEMRFGRPNGGHWCFRNCFPSHTLNHDQSNFHNLLYYFCFY